MPEELAYKDSGTRTLCEGLPYLVQSPTVPSPIQFNFAQLGIRLLIVIAFLLYCVIMRYKQTPAKPIQSKHFQVIYSPGSPDHVI